MEKAYMAIDAPLLPPLRTLAFAVSVLALAACGDDAPAYSTDDARSFHEWLDTDRPSPAQFIADARNSGSLAVLLQDDELRADTADLARSLLPALYDAGIREWGVFFMDAGRQDELDNLVSGRGEIGASEAAAVAEELLFAADASLGYREYRDFLLYAREFNAGLDPGEAPLRVRALSSGRVVDSAALKGPAGPTGEESAETAAEGVGAAGDEEEGAAENANGALEGTAHEAAVFSGILWIRTSDLLRFKDAEGLPEPYVAVHALPRTGTILSESSKRDIRDRTFAFEPASPAFSGWEASPDEADADLVIVTPFAFRAVEPIPGFISTESSPEASRDFPEVRMKTPSAAAASKMNRLLGKKAKRYRRTVARSLD